MIKFACTHASLRRMGVGLGGSPPLRQCVLATHLHAQKLCTGGQMATLVPDEGIKVRSIASMLIRKIIRITFQ